MKLNFHLKRRKLKKAIAIKVRKRLWEMKNVIVHLSYPYIDVDYLFFTCKNLIAQTFSLKKLNFYTFIVLTSISVELYNLCFL